MLEAGGGRWRGAAPRTPRYPSSAGMLPIPHRSITDLLGRHVRAFFARPVDLGGGIQLARVEGVMTHSVPATFARRTFSLRDVSAAIDPAGHDIAETAGLFGAVITADLRNLVALERVPP